MFVLKKTTSWTLEQRWVLILIKLIKTFESNSFMSYFMSLIFRVCQTWFDIWVLKNDYALFFQTYSLSSIIKSGAVHISGSQVEFTGHSNFSSAIRKWKRFSDSESQETSITIYSGITQLSGSQAGITGLADSARMWKWEESVNFTVSHGAHKLNIIALQNSVIFKQGHGPR